MRICFIMFALIMTTFFWIVFLICFRDMQPYDIQIAKPCLRYAIYAVQLAL